MAQLRAPLLTLTGPQHAGKTRFALELARRGPERAIFVPLTGANDAAVVANVASALHTAADSRAALVAALRDRAEHEPLLVVLDDCDGCRDGVIDVVMAVAGIDGIRTVVTGERPLALRGEHAFAVDTSG